MNGYNRTHNDIKPQNFLVKFENGPDDLTKIKIALTDFGLAGPGSQGGTPIFASPECFEKKDEKSDLFSFGRVILFLLISKEQFSKWLFVPIKDSTRASNCRCLTNRYRFLNLVSRMMSITSRIDLRIAIIRFNLLKRDLRIKLNGVCIGSIDTIVKNEISNDMRFYVSELCDFRLSDSLIL